MSSNETPGGGSRLVRIGVRLVVGVAILALAVAFYFALYSTKPQAPRSEDRTASPIVRTMTAERVDTRRRFDGFGTARAKLSADITAEIDALVIERPAAIDPGVAVKGPSNGAPGDTIAVLDARDFEDLAEAAQKRTDALQAQLDGLTVERESLQERLDLADEAVRLAELDLQRLRDAIGDDIENPTEIERRLQQLTVTKRDAARIRETLSLLPSRRAALESQLAEQRAALRTAQLNVERTRIAAPFDGVLQTVDIDPGERVARGQVVARVVNLAVIEVPVRLPASAGLDLAPGSPVTIIDERDAGVGRGWDGTVARIAPEIDPATRTLSAFVEVSQDPTLSTETLLPGTFVRAVAQGLSTDARLVVPRGSINDDRVWVVAPDGTLALRAARPLFPIDTTFESLVPGESDWVVLAPTYRGTAALQPLDVGERLVLNPSQDLRLGRPVRTEADLEDSATTLVSTPPAQPSEEASQ